MFATSSTEICHCGRPLHYANAALERQMKAMIEKHGAFTEVRVGDRRWSVPRHYIALHGINTAEIATLGFEEKSDAVAYRAVETAMRFFR